MGRIAHTPRPKTSHTSPRARSRHGARAFTRDFVGECRCSTSTGPAHDSASQQDEPGGVVGAQFLHAIVVDETKAWPLRRINREKHRETAGCGLARGRSASARPWEITSSRHEA